MDKRLAWILVIFWMVFIFYLSNQPVKESNKLSLTITEEIVEIANKVVPDKEFNKGKHNHIVRKNAHFFFYFVLGILVLNALNRSTFKLESESFALAMLICVIYVISDEIHQLFVPGRGAQAKDVVIDSIGATFGIGFYLLTSKIMKK